MKLEEFVDNFYEGKFDEYVKYIISEMKAINFRLFRYIPIYLFEELKDDDDIKKNLLHEKQYGFNSVVNKYIYHNTPRFFNDPFDCVFGMDQSAFLKEFLSTFLQIKQAEKAYDYFNQSSIIYEYPDDFKKELNNLDIHQSLKEFIGYIFESAYKSATTSENMELGMETFKNDILKNPEKFILLLNPFLQNKIDQEKFSTQINNIKDNLKESPLENYLLNFKKPQLEQFIKIPNNHNFINEFDIFSSKFTDSLNLFNNKIFNFIDNKFGVASLTSSFNNPIMWSHYASSHKGLCIEYDFSETLNNFESSKMFLYPVSYQKERVVIDSAIIDKIDLKDIENKGRQDLLKIFFAGLYTKHTSWGYESEWRSITVLTKNNEIERCIEAPKIKAIYLGNKMDPKIKNNIYQILKNNVNTNSIEIFEMINDVSSYDIKKVKYNPLKI